MADPTHVRFSGGPLDGHDRWIPGAPLRWTLPSIDPGVRTRRDLPAGWPREYVVYIRDRRMPDGTVQYLFNGTQPDPE